MAQYTDLFFDFDDTLYDTHGNALVALNEVYDIFHLEQYFNKRDTFINAYWLANMQLWAMYAEGKIERDYLMAERFRQPLSEGFTEDGARFQPSRKLCLDINNVFLELNSQKSGVVPGAHETAKYLHNKGYKLHICSNGFPEVQYKKLKVCGLADYFNTVVLSYDAGANKPQKAFFDYAFRVTGAKPQTTLMIGDNYYTDIVGAQNAGIDTMFFNAKPSEFTAPTPVNYEIHSLTDISKIL